MVAVADRKTASRGPDDPSPASTLGVGHEHPATPQFWQAALRDAGFTGVRF